MSLLIEDIFLIIKAGRDDIFYIRALRGQAVISRLVQKADDGYMDNFSIQYKG